MGRALTLALVLLLMPAMAWAEIVSGEEVACYQSRDLDLSIEACTTLLDWYTNRRSQVHAYTKRGQAYLEKGEFDRAISDFTITIRLTKVGVCGAPSRIIAATDPDSKAQWLTPFWFPIGPHAMSGHLDGGIAEYAKANADDPKLARDYAILENAYGTLGCIGEVVVGNVETLLVNWGRLIPFKDMGIAPESHDRAYRRRAKAYAAKGEKAKAEADFAKARALRQRR